jgi:uncharacterized protein YbjT (DUF2867 family)
VKRYLVIGAAGTVGANLADVLLGKGCRVVATTHRKSRACERGALTWAYLDVATGEGLEKAFDGIDGAFLMAPPGFADHHAILSPLIAEAKRRGLEKVVLMSAMGANAGDTPLRRAEVELERAGLRYNIIRPNWFMQNFNTIWAGSIRDEGTIRLPAGRAKVSYIDARDIAAVAAQLLTTRAFDNRDLDLTGAQAIDHVEIAGILSETTGRKIAYEDIAPAVMREGLLAAGLPADYVAFLLVILEHLRQGHAERTTTAVHEVLERDPIPFTQYARDYRAAWSRAA